jgi:hypothetical protein
VTVWRWRPFGHLPLLEARTRAIIEPNQRLIRDFIAAHASSSNAICRNGR